MSENGAARARGRSQPRSWLVALPLFAFAVLAGLFWFRLGAGDPVSVNAITTMQDAVAVGD